MEIRLNLATASLKDAEHALFVIGAYFGLTQARVSDVRITVPAQDLTVDGGEPGPSAVEAAIRTLTPGPTGTQPNAIGSAVGATTANLGGQFVTGSGTGYTSVNHVSLTGDANPAGETLNPAAVFGSTPAPLPPGAGEAPMGGDPAAVFATGQGGPSGSPTAGPSAPPAGVVGAGEAGNAIAPTVGGPVGSLQAPPPAPGASVSAVELDSTGLPWDGRIHSLGDNGTHPKTDKGVWRKKRNVQPMLVSQVETELRTLLAATPGAQVAAPQPPAPPGPQGASAPLPPGPPPQNAPEVLPGTPTPPASSPQPDPTTFEQLMPRVVAAVGAGILPQTALGQAAQAYGVAQIPLLATRPDLIPSVWTYLRSLYPTLQ